MSTQNKYAENNIESSLLAAVQEDWSWPRVWVTSWEKE